MTEQNKKIKIRANHSLSFTLTIAFLSLSTVTLLSASLLEAYFTFQTQQQTITTQQYLIAQEAANRVQSFIQEKISKLDVSARLSNLLTKDKEEQNLALQKMLGLEPAFRQLVLVDKNGKEIAVASRLSNYATKLLTVRAKQELLSVTNGGQTYISPVYLDEGTNEPKITVAVPIKSSLGDVEGAITAEINLKFMWDLVSSIKIGEKGTAYVVNKKGDLIAFEDTGRVLKGENISHLEEVAEFKNGYGHSSTTRVDVSKGIRNTDVVSTYVPLGAPDWALVVELPVNEAYVTTIQALIRSLIVIFVGFILAVIASIILSKKITKPIILLRNAVSQISVGKFDTSIDVSSRNEIGELAETFKAMTKQLKESYSVLEQKVKEKTVELETKVSESDRMNRLMVGRELKMIELKKELERLEQELEKKKSQT